METLALGIGGMQSGTCAGKIEKLLYGIDGVQTAVVSFAQENAEIVYDPARTNPARLASAVADAGYTARLPDGAVAPESSAPVSKPPANSGCG
jgi:copper chaperone CopZ